MEALHDWLHDQVGRVSGASDPAKAMRYAIQHWGGLIALLDDDRIEMDINVVERTIRPRTLTRKNALSAGSDGGARHWAIAMTLIQTAKLNGVDPMALAHRRAGTGRLRSHQSPRTARLIAVELEAATYTDRRRVSGVAARGQSVCKGNPSPPLSSPRRLRGNVGRSVQARETKR